LVWVGVEHCLAPSFPVHKEGVVLITGASTGLGKHAALALDKLGFVVFAGVRKVTDFTALSNEFSPRSKPILLDVTSSEDVARAFHEVSAHLQSTNLPFVALINNAGLGYSAPVEFTDQRQLRNVFNVNVFGVFDITREFIPLLRKHHGRIINIGSVAGLVAKPFSAVYSGTKFALEAFNDALRRELLPHQVAVSIIEPAYVLTAIADKATEYENLSEDELSLYDFKGVIASRKEVFTRASPPDVVTEAIEHALTHPTPRTRYVVANVNGVPAWVITRLLWLLPDRIADKLVK